MTLSIKNRETEALAREVAALANKPITRAVHDALLRERRYEKALKRKLPRDDFMEKIREMQARVAKLPVLDDRTLNEILYDEFGLPK
jgi:antitoxin VapB